MSVAQQYRQSTSKAILAGLQSYVSEATTYKSNRGDPVETWEAYQPSFNDLEAVWGIATARVAAGSQPGDDGFDDLKAFVEKQGEALNGTISELKVTRSAVSAASRG